MRRATRQLLIRSADCLAAVPSYCAALFLATIRSRGIQNFPLSKRAMLSAGAYPLTHHYYDPLVDPAKLFRPLSDERPLPGIDWNIDEQLALLERFTFSRELDRAVEEEPRLVLPNSMFGPGDAEYWYNLIRVKKPKKIIEVGCGYSTLLAQAALRANARENAADRCEHICIEPYENPWLESLDVDLQRQRLEVADRGWFATLQEDDILFIDSSHAIRPQGDAVIALLEIVPSLQPGVIVHFHDIFSPRDYLETFVFEQMRIWGEQYLLEAFMSYNSNWKIIGSVYYLSKHHYKNVHKFSPTLVPTKNPGSFYIQRLR